MIPSPATDPMGYHLYMEAITGDQPYEPSPYQESNFSFVVIIVVMMLLGLIGEIIDNEKAKREQLKREEKAREWKWSSRRPND